MNDAQVERFLALIGAEGIVNDASRGWVRAKCPLAPWTHAHGTDRKPSFGVKLGSDGEPPFFNCYSCGVSGHLPKLLHLLQLHSKQMYPQASALLSSLPELFEWAEKKQEASKGATRRIDPKRVLVDVFAQPDADITRRKLRREVSPYVPDEVLAQYPLLVGSDLNDADVAIRWLTEERKISVQLIASHGLRLYTDPVLQDIGVVFPLVERGSLRVRDLWVRMVAEKTFFRLTAVRTQSPVDYHAKDAWFGDQFYDQQNPVFLVEGAFDHLRLRTLGVKNVLAALGTPSAEQLAAVSSSVVYVGFDADDAGRKFAKRAIQNVDAQRMYLIRWDDVTNSQGKPLKDAGELESLAQFKEAHEKRIAIEKRSPSSVILKRLEVAHEVPTQERVRKLRPGTFL